jgi:hypothetical protein
VSNLGTGQKAGINPSRDQDTQLVRGMPRLTVLLHSVEAPDLGDLGPGSRQSVTKAVTAGQSIAFPIRYVYVAVEVGPCRPRIATTLHSS